MTTMTESPGRRTTKGSLYAVMLIVSGILVGVRVYADTTKPSEEGKELLRAIECLDKDKVSRMLERGMTVTNILPNGYSPLVTLVRQCIDPYRHSSRAILVRPSVQSKEVNDVIAKSNDVVGLASIFLEHGANPNEKCDDDNPLLIIALQNGRLDVAEILIQKGVDAGSAACVDVMSGDGPLHMTVKNTPMLTLLLDCGAKPNAANKIGITPLMVAAMNGCVEGVEILLERGADIDKRDKSGYSAVFHAVSVGDVEMVRCLMKKGCSLTGSVWIRNVVDRNNRVVGVETGNISALIRALLQKTATDSPMHAKWTSILETISKTMQTKGADNAGSQGGQRSKSP